MMPNYDGERRTSQASLPVRRPESALRTLRRFALHSLRALVAVDDARWSRNQRGIANLPQVVGVNVSRVVSHDQRLRE